LTPGELELYEVTIARCGGIPKVIATIGQLFAKTIAKGVDDCNMLLKDINDDFMGMLESDQGCHNLRDLFSWMQSYFDGCSDNLKPCIFYLSIFPPNHNIRWSYLFRRWIAEGYCRDTYSGTAEENGKMLLSELINLSIIQQSEKAMKCIYQVNGFFHEYIISRPMEDNLIFALDGDLERIAKVLPRLKFLSLRGCKEISHLPESFGGLRQLQTLHVRHTSIAMLPFCIIKLQKLQYIRAGTIISSAEADESVASTPTTNVDRTSTPPEGSDDMVTTLQETTEEVHALRASTIESSKLNIRY
jgi:hypothetical protein